MAPCARDLGTAPGAARTTSSNVAVAAVVCFFLREKQRERELESKEWSAR
jgi:hypothetical protein